MEQNISIIHGDVHGVTEQSIPALFDSIVNTVPNQTAVTFEGLSHTFRQLHCLENRIRTQLARELGESESEVVGPKDMIIALYMPPGVNRIVTLLAILKFQAAYVPLDSVLPLERMRHILRESQPVCIITTDETCSQAEEISQYVPVITYESLLASSNNLAFDNNCIKEKSISAKESDVDPLVCILYTSGSTGTPKGCRLRTSNLLNRLSWQWTRFPFQENDVGCHKTSILFVDSLTEMFSCLLQGVPLVVASREVMRNPKKLVQLLEKCHVTRVVVVPSLLRAILNILKLSNSNLPEIRETVCSGETLSPELAYEYFRVFPKNQLLLNFYGSTETTGDVAYDVFTNHDDVRTKTNEGLLSIGQPVWNCSIYIMDETGKPVPIGTRGDIYVSGCNIIEGYMDRLQNDVLLLNSYSTNPNHLVMHKTGDIGKVENGRIIYQGRKDNLVKVRGYRVNTLEVESILKGINELENIVIMGYEMPNRSTILVMFYTILPSQCPSQEQIISKCKEYLPEYMIPSLIKLEEMPLQKQTGKVDRIALKAIFARRLEQTKYPRELQGESMQETILLLVSEELGISRPELSLGCNFFSVGGNSISATSLLVKLKERGLYLSVNDFLEAKNIEEIVDIMTKNRVVSTKEQRRIVNKYHIVSLSKVADQRIAMGIIAKGFSTKHPLAFLTGTSEVALYQFVESIWQPVLRDNLSFVVEDSAGRIVAVTILLDARTELQPNLEMEAVLEILEAVENPVKCRLLEQGGKWLNFHMVAIDASNSQGESMWVLQIVEEEVLQVARKSGFDGILTVNSHPVTTAFGEHFLGYEVWNSLNVKDFMYEGVYPFRHADADYNIKTMVKRIN